MVAPERCRPALAELIAAVGVQHPSAAVRRHNPDVPVAIDPFVRTAFPVIEAFRVGVLQARGRSGVSDDLPTADGGDDVRRRVDLATEVGRRLVQARTAAGLTQHALAMATGVRLPTLLALERGHVWSAAVADLLAVAEALKIDARELLP
jgi:DNA-binding XRE family transcriptional regulator